MAFAGAPHPQPLAMVHPDGNLRGSVRPTFRQVRGPVEGATNARHVPPYLPLGRRGPLGWAAARAAGGAKARRGAWPKFCAQRSVHLPTPTAE